jgi:hypothetical protein
VFESGRDESAERLERQRRLNKDVGGTFKIFSRSRVNISGNEGRLENFEDKATNLDFKYSRLTVMRGGICYMAEYQSPARFFDRHLADFKRFIDSLSITPI